MAPKTTIEDLGIDLLKDIVSRLPAFAFASADCVSRTWNQVCGRVLCRTKISSACSFNDNFQVAVEDVVNKVLSEPIRPQFAIACTSIKFPQMQEAYQLITAKLSSKVPVVFNYSWGTIGRDAISGEFKEVEWLDIKEKGLMLTVGYAPGLKVKIIPLLKQSQEPRTFMTDQLITDIREFSTSISGCHSPASIIIFSEDTTGMNVVMEKLDYAMSPETVIVGEYTSGVYIAPSRASVALVFVKDRNKPPGIGETRFHAVLSSGLSPVGPTYTVNFVRENPDITTNLTGVGEEPFEIDERDEFSTVCIGVTKKRICSIGQEAKSTTRLTLHYILEQREGEPLWVEDVGIKIGDTFRYYFRVNSCVGAVSELLRSLKQRSGNGIDNSEVCGCLIFASHHRPIQQKADRSAFLENFPGVTYGGDFCKGAVGPAYLTLHESQEQKSTRGCLHEYGAVYLIISYAP